MAGAAQLRRLIGQRGFRTLYAARLTSQGADGIFEASLVSYVLFSPQRATSADAIAASLAVVLLPFSIIGPFAGIVLDRVSRQRVLVVCSLVRAALVALLVVLIAAGHTGVDFYGMALAVFSVNRFVLSALSAGLPLVVGEPDLVTANSLSTTSGTMATLSGAGLGSGIRGLVGAHDSGVALVAALAALAYLAAAATAAVPRRRDFGPLAPGPWQGAAAEIRLVVGQMVDGARHLWLRRRAREALAALTASRACYGLAFVATILLYRNYFIGAGGGLPGLAAVIAASGVGMVTAAVVTPRATVQLSKQAWIALALGAAAVAQLAFALLFTPGWFLVAAPIIGFSAQAAKICVDTIVQEEIEDTFRGRAFSLYDLLFNVGYVVAAAVGALTLPATGRSYPIGVAIGVGYALSGLLFWVGVTRDRRRITPPVPSAPPSGPGRPVRSPAPT